MTNALEKALGSMLAQHPHALVAAIDVDGLFVPLPSSFEATGHGVVRARSALELVDPSERRAMIDTWVRVRATGAATGTARLYDGSAMTYAFFDVRASHGVFVGVFLVDAEPERVNHLETREPIPPRTGRLQKDEMAFVRGVDDAILQILGWERDELVGTRALELVHPDDRDRGIDSWMEMLGAPGGAARWRGRHLRRDGTYLWMEVTNHNELHDEPGVVQCDMVDISDEMHALEALGEREQVLARLAEALPLGVAHVDPGGRILYANERLHELVGRDASSTLDEQLAGIVPDDRRVYEAAARGALVYGRDADLEVRIRVPNRPRLHCFSLTLRALLGAEGDPLGAVVCAADITESAELRVELERRATTDDLTGCLNRSAIIATLDRTLEASAPTSSGTAVVFVDLDGLKDVNDEHGHRAGDHVLVATATRLRAALREGDSLGRLGGDEFLIVLPNADSTEAAMRVGRRMAEAVDCPLMADGVVVHLRASIGVAWTTSPATDGDALIAAADRAMYESKRSGAGSPVAHLA